MKRVLFIDRDGTLIREPADEQIDSLEKLEFLPGVIRNLYKIRTMTDFELVLVSNQDGRGTASFPEEAFIVPHRKMLDTLKNEGIWFDAEHIDPSFPHENSPNRKPGTGMLGKYKGSGYDLAHSFVIGDRLTDIQLAANLGAKAIFLSAEQHKDAALTTTSWDEIFLCLYHRREAQVHRKTSETDISVYLNLDNDGSCTVHTGIGFFDHMLEQIGRHGGIQLDISASGDLQVDEHHTIEDTGLTLGLALTQALGKKTGIGRYGFSLPMDDSSAEVLLDLGGRPYLKWDVDFSREKIGDCPTEMISHFFRSLCDSARCNLHVKASGENDHHKAEAVFKAFARALRVAVQQNGTDVLPSTKGNL